MPSAVTACRAERLDPSDTKTRFREGIRGTTIVAPMFHIRWIMAYGMSGPRASWRSADSRGGQRVLCRRHPLGECRRRSTVGHRSNVNARTRVARLLKNAGPRVQEVPTGFEGEPDPPFNVTITTRAPREGDLQVFDLNAARY